MMTIGDFLRVTTADDYFTVIISSGEKHYIMDMKMKYQMRLNL